MSRSLLAIPAACLLLASPLPAQDTPSPPPENRATTADEVFAKAREAYGPPAPEPDCEPQQGEEIVVCGDEPDDPDRHRIRSPERAEDEYAAATMNRGNPPAPDPCGPNCGIFKGPPTVSGVCGIGLNPCPPPPAYMVDFSALPEAPPGSDADRIARGLPPVGNDGPAVAQDGGAARDPAAEVAPQDPAVSPR